MSSLHAATIVARNYLPFARVLAASFREHHPDGVFAVLLLDDTDRSVSDSTAGMEIIRPEEFIEIRELHRMAMIYDITELSTATKPLLLQYLLGKGWPHVIYLDPDIRIYQSIQDLADLVEKHQLVLTPHTTEPMERDDRKPAEFDILQSGVYNLGFLGVGPRSTSFLDYWSARLRRDCLADHQRMMFTDQRWVDFAPGYFEHHILRDPTVNVAYWNVDKRHLRRGNDGYEVQGLPLRFFHFSGFDPSMPYLLSKHQGETPRTLLSANPILAELCQKYADEVRAAGWGAEPSRSYGFGKTSSGLPLTRRIRRLLRDALMEAEASDGDEPPDPFTWEGSVGLVEWLNEPARPNYRPGISRYLERLHQERTDLSLGFRNLAGPNGDLFVDWVLAKGQFQEDIPLQLLPSPTPIELRRQPRTRPGGVNIAGYFKAELGMGELGRLVLQVFDAAGIQTSTYTVEETPSRQNHPFNDRGNWAAPYDVNVLCVNADRISEFREAAGGAYFGGYTVGVWAWETEDFPTSMRDAFDCVDEVWGLSTFTADVLRRHTSKPVHAFPLPVVAPESSGIRTLDGLVAGNRFKFLFMFDFLSVVERKNPLGLIEAFRSAFSPGEGPVLVLKTINGDKSCDALEQLRVEAAEHPDVLVIDGYLDPNDRTALLAECDAYVSLHRAEGFGLTIAEAMSLGKPVIATAYSGNLDFMTETNSFLVGYKFTKVPAKCEPYVAGGRWADPDIAEAARIMRLLVDEPEVGASKGRMALEDMRKHHSVEARVPLIRHRLAEVNRIAGPRQGGVDEDKQAPDPLVEAADIVEHPPGTGESRLGRAGALARRVLMRLLRPYWFGQRSLDRALVQAGRAERLRREEVDAALSERIEALSERLAQLSDVVTPTSSQISRLTSEVVNALRRLEEIDQDIRQHAVATPKQSSALVADTRTSLGSTARMLGGGIDQPIEGAIVGPGALLITGWAITAPYPVSRVEITVDGGGKQNAQIGLPRPDLEIIQPDPQASTCGFEAWLDLEALDHPEAELEINAVAFGTDGSPHPLGNRRVKVHAVRDEGAVVAPARILPSLRLSRSTRSSGGQRRLLVFTGDLEHRAAQLGLVDMLSALTRTYKATVVTPSDGPLRAALEALGIDVDVASSPPIDSFPGFRSWVEALTQRLSLLAPDAVIVNSLVPFWGIEIAEALGAPSLWALQEHTGPSVYWASWCHLRGTAMHPQVLRQAELSFQLAGEVVLRSPASEAVVSKYRRTGISVIRDAVDVDGVARRHAEIDPMHARRNAQIDPNAQVVLCAGAIEPSSGQVVLARAIAMLRPRHPELQALLVGSKGGDYEEGLLHYIERTGLDSIFRIHPLPDDLLPWLAAADIVACPSPDEVQPAMVLESMACRVPVVATNVGDATDVVVDGRTGYACKSWDVASLAVSLDRSLRASERDRKAMTDNAYELVERDHGAVGQRAAYRALLSRLVGDARETLPEQDAGKG